MAEISYPFSQANAYGGSEMVSQGQWQDMARMWGGDRAVFQPTRSSYANDDLPFWATCSGRTVHMHPGSAWVGGFHYQLLDPVDIVITSNPTDRTRYDLIVARLDMDKGSVNIGVVVGSATVSPIVPPLTRDPAGIWEMALHRVTVPGRDAAVTNVYVVPLDMPPRVATPWNTIEAAENLPQNSFAYDLDVNNNDTQWEAFKGRDRFVVTRDFSKSRRYTPSLLNVNSPGNSSLTRSGRWRWIAPNVFFVSINLFNKGTGDLSVSSGNYAFDVSLPLGANAGTGQVISGHLWNPQDRVSYPNFMAVTALVQAGKNTDKMRLYVPNPSSPAEGLDGLHSFPKGGTLIISGVIEANVFGE